LVSSQVILFPNLALACSGTAFERLPVVNSLQVSSGFSTHQKLLAFRHYLSSATSALLAGRSDKTTTHLALKATCAHQCT